MEGSHDWHSDSVVDPLRLENFPNAHLLQTVAPNAVLYRPLSQAVQA